VSTESPGFMHAGSAVVLAKWNNGNDMEDAELDDLEKFFTAMVAGAEALGARYGLWAMGLRMELKHVRRLKALLASGR